MFFTPDTIIFIDNGLPHEIIRVIEEEYVGHDHIVSSDGISCRIPEGHQSKLGRLRAIHTALQEIRNVRAGLESTDAERIVIEGKETDG